MKKIVLFFLFLMLSGCGISEGNAEQTKLSFYYWKTRFKLDSLERSTLKELEVEKLYIRYFDIGLKDGAAVPVSPIVFKDSIPRVEVVPVVYIKNEVMLNTPVDKQFVQRIIDYVQQINKHNNLVTDELQLDCDWSVSSKDSFFKLVKEIKGMSGWTVSSTIRLHQVKYAGKTGIPEVDYGVLMYYNMGTIAADSLNSIYDRKIASQYLGAMDIYPLDLKYAFAIYSWGVHSRNGKVVRLISRIREEDVESVTAFTKLSSFQYRVNVEGIYFGHLFKEGDLIKLESTTAEQLLEMKTDLYDASGKHPLEIILYDLNSKNITNYEKEIWEKLALHR